MAVRDEKQRNEKHRFLRKIYNECYFGQDLVDKERELLNIQFTSPKVYIEMPFQFDYGTNIHFSGRFYANRDCLFLDTADIYFGKNVTVGPRVQIYTATHTVGIERTMIVANVRIEDNVWIGGGAIINPGVTIGKNSVVAAGSVVTKSVAPNTLVAGVPAKFVRVIDNENSNSSK